MNKNIRSSVSEFLIYLIQNNIDFKNIKIMNNDIYLTKDAICNLLGIQDNIDSIIEKIIDKNHLYYYDAEINIENTYFYSIDVIIYVSFTIRNDKTIQFRSWANKVIINYIRKGYILDDERITNGKFFNEEYFEELKLKFDLIKMSNRDFYQKITDMYATSFDYDGFSYFSRKLFIDVINVRTENDIKLKNIMLNKLLNYAYKKIDNQIPMTMSDWNNLIRNYALYYKKNNNLDEYITDFEKMIIN